MVSKPLRAVRCGSRAEQDAALNVKQAGDYSLSQIADGSYRSGDPYDDGSLGKDSEKRETATPVTANRVKQRSISRSRSRTRGVGDGATDEMYNVNSAKNKRSSSRSKRRGGGRLLRRMKCGDRRDEVDDTEVPLGDSYYNDSRREDVDGTYLGGNTFNTMRTSTYTGTSTVDMRDETTATHNSAAQNGYPNGLLSTQDAYPLPEPSASPETKMQRKPSRRIRNEDPLTSQNEAGDHSRGNNIINGVLTTNSVRELQNIQVAYKKFVADPVKGMKVRKFDYVPMPEESNDVVIRVKASTVTYKDCIIRKGMWSEAIDLPAVPGFDCIGVVENIGDDVNSPQESGRRIGEGPTKREPLKVGDPVAALVQTGGNARYVTVDASQVFPVPGECDSAQAACVLSCYMTAYQALHRTRPRDKFDTLEGKKVLITGGIGPVGMAAIELALRAGAGTVYATVEDRYHSTLRARHPKGNLIPLPLHPKLWLPHVQGKMDCVVDGLCQDGYESPRAALNSTGALVCVGANSILLQEGGPGVFGGPPASVMWAKAKAGYFMGSQTKTYEVHDSFKREPERFRHDAAYLYGLLSRGKIKPSVAERISLKQVPDMHRRMERGEICGGVVVVKPWQQKK